MSIARRFLPWLLGSLAGVVMAGVGAQARTQERTRQPAARASGEARDEAAELLALRAEVDRLKGLTPSQSHTMQDVAYHFTNLWFAGQHRNWPLAGFYLEETRSHLKWAVRVVPVRRTKAGPVELEGIRQAFDSSSLAGIERAIDGKDAPGFADAYKLALEGCYACHKAAEKPFLRPQVPTQPEVQIVNFDPDAKWPQ